MKKAIIAGLVILGDLLASAATVVDLNLNLSGDVAPARAIDVNTPSNQTYDWSSSSPLFNGPVTAGNQNTKIYGAFSASAAAGVLSNATVKLDEAAPDRILFQCDKLPGITNSTAELRAVAFWDATNFLASGNTRFDDSTNSSLTIGVGSWLNASGITSYGTHEKAENALRWAAYTYVIAALGSLATLLYYIMIFMGRRE